jgi:CRISP-associated protein Cas1
VTIKDLHILPRVRDSWSFLYVEHCRVDQEAKAIAVHDVSGRVPVPCATLTLLMLGPGTTITHAAVHTLAESGCLVAWTGEGGVRFYALGTGETRSADQILRQARLVSRRDTRLQVVLRMYRMRFKEALDESLTLQQIRGKEGVRVRQAYAKASEEAGVVWKGRSYRRDAWTAADPVNRALSAANSCLYGVCHAAIVAAGYSPALGFIHTGKALSFVYDVADLYKADLTIPLAFQEAAAGPAGIETRVRHACRDWFRRERLLDRIVPDLDHALDVGAPVEAGDADFDADAELPADLWDPDGARVPGGVNFGEE